VGAGPYELDAIDDCTPLRVLKIYPANNPKTAIQFSDYMHAVLEWLLGNLTN
jgi:hypothetical protein